MNNPSCSLQSKNVRMHTFLYRQPKIREIEQSPDYPMQFMLGIYEIPTGIKDDSINEYPNEFIIDYVRGYKKINSSCDESPFN